MPGRSEKKTKINNYSIIKLIGKGGMGEVYLARHPTLKREIILKKLLTKNKDNVERFLKEAKVMLEFRHENIVQIYDHFKEGQATYIAMEYVHGKALNDVINENETIPIPIVLYILYQTAMGLHHAHIKKVIHRDIKPHNILIATSGSVKLTDFGIAKVPGDNSEDSTTPGTIIGTPAYMSPEQFSESREITYQTDIYSLGVVFYEMLTGVRPYKNEFSPEIISNITKGNYAPLQKYVKNIPFIVRRILVKTFNPDESKRYKTLLPLIKLLRSYFKKYNILEIKDALVRLIKNDKKLLHAPFFRNLEKRKKRNKIILIASLSIFVVSFLSFVFIKTDRYYEWFAMKKYGKVIFEFSRANLNPDNLFYGIGDTYHKANFKKQYKFNFFKKGKKFIELDSISNHYRKVFYLPVGEQTFSVLSGFSQNIRVVQIAPRVMQKSSSSDYNGQKVVIPMTKDLFKPKEVEVSFVFWDSITEDLLFKFEYYSGNNVIEKLQKEENELLFYNGKQYIRYKNYAMYMNTRGLATLRTQTGYYFKVKDYQKNGIVYDEKKFKVEFAFDDRTVVIHTPLAPRAAKIIINSNKKSLPLFINGEKSGLVYKINNEKKLYEYTYENYRQHNIKTIDKNKYRRILLIPPGDITIQISKKGNEIKKFLKSDEELIINVNKEHGKYNY